LVVFRDLAFSREGEKYMAILSKPTGGVGLAIGYITIGSLLDVWATIWYAYLRNHQPETNLQYYFCAGFFLTGLVLVILGLTIGRIGRAARKAELPPSEVTPAVAKTDLNAVNNQPQPVQGPSVPTANVAGGVLPAAPTATPPPPTYVQLPATVGTNSPHNG
jgi:hypothetical protein